MKEEKYLTVAALTRYLKYKFDSDEHLKTVFLKGEISNFKAHSSGHFYFSIKDETSKINAIMFNSNTKRLTFKPTDGMKVLVIGRVSIFESTGNYQIYVEDMSEDGVGNLYIAFEKLKQQLSKEGLFDCSHKMKIPKIPNRIGIITAPTGAAIRDILSTIKRRFPICETILFPSLVQGEGAKEDIVRNIKRAEKYNLDVLIIGRGGGSIEDLWAFNEEMVARAIYECPIPTISAVGHEVDYTIADFVSDMRAPTPTGAAELAVPHINDIKKLLEQMKFRYQENIIQKLNYTKLRLHKMKNSFVLKNPVIMYENRKQMLDMTHEKLKVILERRLELAYQKLKHWKQNYLLTHPIILYEKNLTKLTQVIEKLKLLNPLYTLERGFTLTYQENELVKKCIDIKRDKPLQIRFQDGTIDVHISK